MKILYFFGLVLLIAYQGLLFLSVIPKSPLSIPMSGALDNSIRGLAPQGWFFFTPVSTYSNTLIIRCSADGIKWGKGQDLISLEVGRHLRNRLGSAEKALYVIQDLVRDVDKDKLETEPRVRNLSAHYCSGNRFSQLELRRVLFAPYSHRHTANLKPSEQLLYTSPIYENI